MRMSRRIGIVASLGMHPDSVTVTGGKMQYWASASTTTDGWHNSTSGGVTRYIPYDNYVTYVGRNDNKVYHNAALAFKTGSFTGKGKHISVTFSVQSYAYIAGFAYAAQLSKHGWSTESEWMAGSKSYYSSRMTTLPSDPNAIASKTGTFAQNISKHTETISFDAEILPNTEYVLYLIGTSGVTGHLLALDKTASYPMTITVREE